MVVSDVTSHQLTTSKDNKYLILQQNISLDPGGSRHRGGRAVNQSAGGVFVRVWGKTLELETNLRKVWSTITDKAATIGLKATL